jgi:hypothetical protein
MKIRVWSWGLANAMTRETELSVSIQRIEDGHCQRLFTRRFVQSKKQKI